MSKLDIEHLEHVLQYLGDIKNALRLFKVSKKCKQAFEGCKCNAGYSLCSEEAEDTQQDESDESSEKEEEDKTESLFELEMKLFPNRTVTRLTRETMQYLPRVNITPVILPKVMTKTVDFFIRMGVMKPIQEARIQYVIGRAEDRTVGSLEPLGPHIILLELTIDSEYYVELEKMLTRTQNIDTLVVSFKMTDGISPLFFKELDQYHINRVIIKCKRFNELHLLQEMEGVRTNLGKIILCSRFWYTGIEPHVIITWKPNVLYMTDDGVTNIDLIQRYCPWQIEFVETPISDEVSE